MSDFALVNCLLSYEAAPKLNPNVVAGFSVTVTSNDPDTLELAKDEIPLTATEHEPALTAVSFADRPSAAGVTVEMVVSLDCHAGTFPAASSAVFPLLSSGVAVTTSD